MDAVYLSVLGNNPIEVSRDIDIPGATLTDSRFYDCSMSYISRMIHHNVFF